MGTWQETMLASREALARLESERAGTDRLKTWVSPIVRGGDPARHVNIPAAGQKELYLFVVGAPEVVAGCATWADAKLVASNGAETRICHLKGVDIQAPQHSIDRNLESGVSGPLRINGRRFDHGIHVYAPARIRVPLGGRYERFEAEIGIGDWVADRGSVRFVVTGPEGAARLDLWDAVAEDFTSGVHRRRMKWEREDHIWDEDWPLGDYAAFAERYAKAARRVPPLAEKARRLARNVRDGAGLDEVRQLYYRSRTIAQAVARAGALDIEALRLAVTDLTEAFNGTYRDGSRYLRRLAAIEKSLADALSGEGPQSLADLERIESLIAGFDNLRRKALLANPLLDFDRLALVRRKPHGDARRPDGTGYGLGEYIGLPRQSSKCHPNIDRPFDWDNEIAILSPVRPHGRLTTLYNADGRRLITDLDLHWDADRLLFSMPGSHKKWHVFEIGVDGNDLRQVTPGDQPDVHYYDSCYLPDGRIAFVSTAPLQGVPCNASVIVGMMYTMDADGTGVRQVAFEQDHNYCPSVTNDGRILYLRWDYTDTPHVWNRILFTMNPDGTGQMEYYGANSYWPNSVFFARAVPGHPTKVVGIVTGHHVGRVGELVIFDPVRGRQEAKGVVQRIPGRGQTVEPLIQDKLTEFSWPKFLHPYPLSEKYFIVSAKPTPDSLWGIYLVDVFDNMVLLKEREGDVLLEPIPLKRTLRPPVVPPRSEPEHQDAVVYMQDVYEGPSVAGIPRGTVKRLRVFTYHFGYQRIAGINHRVGADGPWEAKRVLGTVRVEADGSALFRIPAKTPISVQPLDAEGKAIQLMRSWMTAMPGETLSCVGCHEDRGSAPLVRRTLASARPPQEIEPWHGPVRGFSFKREVQPVLDKYCVGCHNGKPREDGATIPDLRADQEAYVVYRGGDPKARTVQDTPKKQLLGKFGGIFEPTYILLRRHVRVGGLESDLHLLPPMEFHADTSELFQMLRKGHHGVALDEEARDRLATWIDLNAPCHGTWSELTRIGGNQRKRRRDLARLYGGIDCDPEEILPTPRAPVKPIVPKTPAKARVRQVTCEGWPFAANEARRRQAKDAPVTRTLDLGGGVTVELVRIPAGRVVLGDANGHDDERPRTIVTIGKPFWMGTCEVTNEQFARFDPSHDSRFEHRTSWIFSENYLGWPLNRPRQPVVRVSWNRAMAFCRWLSRTTNLNVTLPTEIQWEYACRAGTSSPFFYGDLDTDFSAFANMADASIRKLAYEGWRPKSPDLVPRNARYDDQALVTADVGSYQPNAWGLHDMHGNAAEWTRTTYRPYPYRDDGRSDPGTTGRKVVRGGSWYDRPKRCRSAFRVSYAPYQPVFNVGFRVVCEAPPEGAAVTARASR
jgi:formylglycine-generating enzyme required for sulfatase activity